MKKVLFTMMLGLLFMATAMTLASCANSNNGENTGSKAESENVEQVPPASDLTSPDLTYFELKGPVKNCDGVEFDRNGTIVTIDGVDPFALEQPYRDIDTTTGAFVDQCRWTRDDKGQIDSIICYEYVQKTRWHEGRVIEILAGFEGQLLWTIYGYDEAGRLVKLTQNGIVETEGPEEINLLCIMEYAYLEFDGYGNWTRRRAKYMDASIDFSDETEETRFIEYYE